MHRSIQSFCCPAVVTRLWSALRTVVAHRSACDLHPLCCPQDRLLALSRRARQALERELQGTHRGVSSRGQRVIGDALGRDERGSLSDRAIRILEEISNLGVQVSFSWSFMQGPAAFLQSGFNTRDSP